MVTHSGPGAFRTAALAVVIAALAAPAAAQDAAARPPGSPLVIVITSGRVETELQGATGAVSVVERAQPVPAAGLGEVLEPVPGLFAGSRFNGAQDLRLSLRGFGARGNFGIRGIRILVDGIPLTLPDGESAVDDLDPALVTRAEVRRGPAGALYGSAAGGVVSLSTGDAAAVHGASIGRGPYGALEGRLRLAGRLAGGAGRADATWQLSDGFREHSQQEHRLLNLRYRRDLARGGELTALLTALDSPFAEDPGGLTAAEAAADRRAASPVNLAFDAGEQVRQQRAGLSHTRPLDRGELRLRGYALRRDFSNRLPFSATELDRRAGALTGELERRGAGWTSVTGLDLELQRDARTRFTNDAGVAGETTAAQDESVTAAGAFTEMTWEPRARLSLSTGLRADRVEFELDDRFAADGDASGARTFSELSPSLGVNFRPDTGTAWFARLGTSFEPPTTTELADASGAGGFNPDVDPQTALGAEAGYRWRHGDGARGEVAVFDTRIEDQLVQRPIPGQPGRFFFVNAGSSRYRGVELSWDGPLRRDLDGRLALSWGDYRFVEFTDAGGGDFAGNRVPGIPAWQATAGLDYRPGGAWSGGAEARWVGERFVDDANTGRSDAYVFVRAHTGWQRRFGGSTLRVDAGIDNLLDVHYDDNLRINASGGRYFEPAPGRTLFVSVALERRR